MSPFSHRLGVHVFTHVVINALTGHNSIVICMFVYVPVGLKKTYLYFNAKIEELSDGHRRALVGCANVSLRQDECKLMSSGWMQYGSHRCVCVRE